MHVVYLHGFASSPRSSKALFFAERFRERGLQFHCPDLNEPDFGSLTISRMLSQLEARLQALPPGEVLLIGSSLGGFVAIEAAARQAEGSRHPVRRLLLLAPAVELAWETWDELGPGGIERWRREGGIEVFHYADEAPRRLAFTFYEDALRYAPAARCLMQPMLIFQGRHDESVSPASVQRFAAWQPHAVLHMLDDGHQLKESLGLIWQETERWLV